MSDPGRKNVSDKISESLKPESEKTLNEQVSERVTDAFDKMAASAQPDSEKSVSQKAIDVFSGAKDDTKAAAKQQEASLADSAKQALDAAGKFVSDITGQSSAQSSTQNKP